MSEDEEFELREKNFNEFKAELTELMKKYKVEKKDNDNYSGLTKREYFAGLAMQSMMVNWNDNESTRKECAKRSIQMADELLKQLDQ